MQNTFQPVTKAVIPCGGLGTRFLPITKSVPKEMLPVIDTPVLSLITSELIASGITDILLILSEGKDCIRSHFSPAPKLEHALAKSGKAELLEQVKAVTAGAKFHFTYQLNPHGSGDAVLYAESFAAGEPFALCWGDDVVYSQTPAIKQLMRFYNQTGKSIVGVQKVTPPEIELYGSVNPVNAPDANGFCRISGVIEKPKRAEAPSLYAALGRYIVMPEIFSILKRTENGKNGELQFTDALNTMAIEGEVYAAEYEGRRYDMGDKFGATAAVTEYALRSPFGEKYRAYLKELLKDK